MKKRSKPLRVGDEFLIFKNQVQLDLEKATGNKFSDAQTTDVMARMFRYKSMFKFGKDKKGKIKISVL